MIIDLIFNDDVTSWEVLDILKQDQELTSIPIIISSCSVITQDKQNEGEKTAGYFVKPYNLSALANRIVTIVKEQQPPLLLTSGNAEILNKPVCHLEEWVIPSPHRSQ